MNHMSTATTAPISSRFGSRDHLANFPTTAYTVIAIEKFDPTTGKFTTTDSFRVSFTDADAALAAVEVAKDETIHRYIASGGNPRNKRAFSTQFAAIKRAVSAAAEASVAA